MGVVETEVVCGSPRVCIPLFMNESVVVGEGEDDNELEEETVEKEANSRCSISTNSR